MINYLCRLLYQRLRTNTQIYPISFMKWTPYKMDALDEIIEPRLDYNPRQVKYQ